MTAALLAVSIEMGLVSGEQIETFNENNKKIRQTKTFQKTKMFLILQLLVSSILSAKAALVDFNLSLFSI